MIICTHCKQPISGGAVQCPYYEHNAICQRHCYECKHGCDWLSGERRGGYYWHDKAAEAAKQA